MKVIPYSGLGQDGSIIKEAAMCCYNLTESSRSTESYIDMLRKRNHGAMLEFSYFPLLITGANYHDILALLNGSYVKVKESKGKIICEGNGRAWLEWVASTNGVRLSINEYLIYVAIKSELNYANPALFKYADRVDGSVKAELLTKAKWKCFKVTGVSRGCTHEMVRHRRFSFAQVSTRYVNMTNHEFVYRKTDNDLLNSYYEQSFARSMDYYDMLIDHDVKKEDARQVLPTGISGDIFIAGDSAAWNNFIKLRSAPEAHWEIRQVSDIIKEYLDQEDSWHS